MHEAERVPYLVQEYTALIRALRFVCQMPAVNAAALQTPKCISQVPLRVKGGKENVGKAERWAGIKGNNQPNLDIK